TGVSLIAPNVRINITGTWQTPRGVVQLQAAQIKFNKAPSTDPPLDDIDLSIRLDRQTASINHCRFLVQDQRVSLTGAIPLGENFWGEKIIVPDWKKAQARLEIDNAQ